MSEQWYCPQCGPVTEVEFEDGDLYTVCIECAENVEDDIPTFVLAMQERIATLEANLEDSNEHLRLLKEYPETKPSEEVQYSRSELEAKWVHALGWAYADCCTTLDKGGNPQQTDMADVLARATIDLKEQGNE